MGQSLDTTRTRVAYVIQELVSESTVAGIQDSLSDASHTVVAIYSPCQSFPASVGTRYDPLLSAHIGAITTKNTTDNSTQYSEPTGDIQIATEYRDTESGNTIDNRKISIFVPLSLFNANTASSPLLQGVHVALKFATRTFNVHLIIKPVLSASRDLGTGRIKLDQNTLFRNYNTLNVPVTCLDGSETAIAAYNSIKLGNFTGGSTGVKLLQKITNTQGEQQNLTSKNIPYAFPHFFHTDGDYISSGINAPGENSIYPLSWIFPWENPSYHPDNSSEGTGTTNIINNSIADNAENLIQLDEFFKMHETGSANCWGERYGTFSSYTPMSTNIDLLHSPIILGNAFTILGFDNYTALPSDNAGLPVLNLFSDGSDQLAIATHYPDSPSFYGLIINQYIIDRPTVMFGANLNSTETQQVNAFSSKMSTRGLIAAYPNGDESSFQGCVPLLNRAHSFFFPKAGFNSYGDEGYVTTCRFFIGPSVSVTNLKNISQRNQFLGSSHYNTSFPELSPTSYSQSEPAVSNSNLGRSMECSRLATKLFYNIQTPLELKYSTSSDLNNIYGAYNTRYTGETANVSITTDVLDLFQAKAFSNLATTWNDALGEQPLLQGYGQLPGKNISFQDVVVLHNVVGFGDDSTVSPDLTYANPNSYLFPTNSFNLFPVHSVDAGTVTADDTSSTFRGEIFSQRNSHLINIAPTGSQLFSGSSLFLPFYARSTADYAALTTIKGRTNVFDTTDGCNLQGGYKRVLLTYPNNSGTAPWTSNSSGDFESLFASSFQIKHVSVVVSDVENGFTQSDAAGLRVSFTVEYLNLAGPSASGALNGQTNAGNFTADTLAEVLQMFESIKFKPGRLDDGSAEWAYEIDILDSSDVESATVIQLNETNSPYSAPQHYRLNIVFLNDILDLNEAGTSSPHSNIVPDLELRQPPASPNDSDDWGVRRFEGFYSSQGYNNVPTDIDQFSRFVTSEIEFKPTTHASAVFVFPFLTYGSIKTIPDSNALIEGCTNSAALNYNSQATYDNGTCQFCDEFFNNALPTDIDDGGQVFASAGNNQFNIKLLYPQPYNAAWGTNIDEDWFQALKNTGTIYSSRPALVGNAASAYGSQDGFDVDSWKLRLQFLSFTNPELANLVAAGAFTIKIYPASEEALEAIPFGELSNSSQSIISTDALLTSGQLYTSSSSHIDTTNFTSEDASEITCNVPHTTSGFVSGSAYIIEAKIDYTSACNYAGFNTTVFVYGFTWVTYCACSDFDNLYHLTPHEWSGSNLFPGIWENSGNATPLQITNNTGCSTSNPTLGGSGDTGFICYSNDAQTDSCDDYWEWCMTNAATNCVVTTNINDLINIDGNLFYPSESVISLHISGLWNPAFNAYYYPDNIQYIVNLLDSTGSVLQSLNQDDAVLSTTVSGAFLTFTTDYVGAFSLQIIGQNELNPATGEYYENIGSSCTLETQEYNIVNDACEVIVGCTDPEASVETYDPNATFSDNSLCEYEPECEAIVIPDITLTISQVAATVICTEVTEEINGVETTWEYPQVQSDGSITVTAVPVNADLFGSTVISIGIVSANLLENAGYSTSELLSFLLLGYDTDGGTVDASLGLYWSPATLLATAASGITVNGLPPGVYYIVATGNIEQQIQFLEDTECLFQSPVIIDSLQQITVQSGTMPSCEEPCIGGSCDEWVLGCTDINAENYNPLATLEDGTCEFDLDECQQNPDDEACIDCFTGEDLAQPVLRGAAEQKNLDDICDPPNTGEGCTDPLSCNYQPDLPLSLSNNQLCDYCSCNEDPFDQDCFPDSGDCDPSSDPECQPIDECPDPSNPLCTPDPPTSSCVEAGDCPPPPPPCVFLGNCIEDPADDDEEDDVVIDVVDPVTVTCQLDLGSDVTSPDNFAEVQMNAFACMADQGKRLLWKLRSGIEYDKTDLLKMSLISYLFMGGTEKTDLPCLWNCNEFGETEKNRERDCVALWNSGGGRFWIRTEFYIKGTTVAYLYTIRGKVKRGYFKATKDIVSNGTSPRTPGSGWGRCTDIRVRTKTANGISDGTEDYLKIMWEYMTRFCTNCSITDSNEIGYPYTIPDSEEDSDETLQSGLPIKTITNNPTGILGADGEEIIF